MQSFQQQVVDEKSELDEKADLDGKIARLEQFFTQAVFRSLLADEQHRLHMQFQHMSNYSHVLGQRIANFTALHSPHPPQPPKVMPAATDEDDDHDD